MNSPAKFDENRLEKLLTAYKSEKRLMIRNLLAIYKELSLTEIAEHMQMSKTAVHHHLKILREANIVETSRQEEARGSIDRKYFQLVKGSWHFEVEDLDEIEDPVRRYQLMKMMIKTLQVVYMEAINRMGMMINFTHNLDDQMDTLDENNPDQTKLVQLQTKLKLNNTHLTNFPLGKRQFEKFLQLKEEFILKVNEMKDSTTEKQSPYLGILIDMPIQSLLEFNINQMR